MTHRLLSRADFKQTQPMASSHFGLLNDANFKLYCSRSKVKDSFSRQRQLLLTPASSGKNFPFHASVPCTASGRVIVAFVSFCARSYLALMVPPRGWGTDASTHCRLARAGSILTVSKPGEAGRMPATAWKDQRRDARSMPVCVSGSCQDPRTPASW